MLKQPGTNAGQQPRRILHYIILLMLVFAISLPAAILPTPVEASPSPPTLLSPANGYSTNVTTITLKWSAPAGAISYDVSVDNNSDFSSLVFHEALTATEVTIPNMADAKYYWKVGAYGTYGGSTGWSKWSSVYNFTVDTVPPAVPGLVSPPDWASTIDLTPKIAWTAVTGGSSYEWQVHLMGTSAVDTGTTASSSYTFPSPLEGGGYYWQVRAFDAAGNVSAWSSPSWHFQVWGPPQLESPTDGSFITSRNPNIWWEPILGAYFLFQLDNNPDFSSPIVSISTYSNYYNINLSDGTYYWRVRYTEDLINLTTEWSPVSHFTIDTIPPAVPALVSPANGVFTTDTTPTLDWNAASGASSYEWHLSQNINFSPLYSSGTTSSTDYTFPSPLPGNLYYWRVRAVDLAHNMSAWTPVWQFSVPPLPTTLTANPVNSYYGGTPSLFATLKTTDGTPLPGYSIDFALNGTSVGNAITDVYGVASLQSVSLSGILPGTYPSGIGASFAGNTIYSARSATAQLSISNAVQPPQEPPPLQPGFAVTGSGWYSFAGTGRINFSFNVNQVPKTAKPVVYKGEFLLINDGKWRLKGTLDSCYCFDPYGSAGGTGQLYSWNSALDNGRGGWELVKDNVSFTIHFGDLNAGGGTGQNKGIVSADQFGINIDHVVPAGGAPLPNSNPTEIKGGNIDIKKETKG